MKLNLIFMKTTFKRLAIGINFIVGETKFRKCSKTQAFRIKPDGRGETHTKLPFSRSCAVVQV